MINNQLKCITLRVNCGALTSAIHKACSTSGYAPLRALAWGYGMVSHFVRCRFAAMFRTWYGVAYFRRIDVLLMAVSAS